MWWDGSLDRGTVLLSNGDRGTILLPKIRVKDRRTVPLSYYIYERGIV
jgi:hypothetical protein